MNNTHPSVHMTRRFDDIADPHNNRVQIFTPEGEGNIKTRSQKKIIFFFASLLTTAILCMHRVDSLCLLAVEKEERVSLVLLLGHIDVDKERLVCDHRNGTNSAILNIILR